jgi:hypothetical protein
MTFPQKSRRQIVIDGETFYWSVRHRVSHEERHNTPHLIPIQHCNGGSLLLADVGYCRSGYADNPTPAITPSRIERCVRDAIQAGWDYSADQGLFFLSNRISPTSTRSTTLSNEIKM